MARPQRRKMRPQVSLGSEKCVVAVFMEATSLEKACFSSMAENAVTTFSAGRARGANALVGGVVSPAGRICEVRVLARGMGVVVDAGLSSLCTTDSMAMAWSSISFTRGKNESTTESSIPCTIQAGGGVTLRIKDKTQC